MRSATLDAAAKHLFRHLDDFRQLEANPIAKTFFGERNALESPLRARQAVSDLRARILETAERLRADDTVAGRGIRAARQYAIIKMQYFDDRSIIEVARTLHISVKHCYRERAEICRRVSRALVDHDGRDVAVRASEDAFYVLLNRLLERQADVSRDELAACFYLENLAQTAPQKAAALQILARLAERLDDASSLEAAHIRATRLYEACARSPLEIRQTVAISLHLIAAKLCRYRGDDAGDLGAARQALQTLERGPIVPSTYVDLMQVYARFELARAVWASGRLVDAYNLVRQAARLCNRLDANAAIRIRVEASLWKLRGYVLLSDPCTSEARIDALMRSRDLALQSGALSEAIDAMVSITECHLFAKRDLQALETARATLALTDNARNPIERTEIAVELGARLMSTRFWREAIRMLPAAESSIGHDSYHKQLLSHAMSLGAFRAGNAEQAWRYSKTGIDDRYGSFAVRTEVFAAACAHVLDRRPQAQRAAEIAVTVAERLQSAPLLRDAYSISGLVLGNPSFRARAQEITRILAA